MSDREVLLIPESFHHRLFFPNDFIYIRREIPIEEKVKTPFLLDLLSDMKGYEIDPDLLKSSASLLFKQWKQAQGSISKAFAKRDRQLARPQMIRGLGWFINVLFWCNDSCMKRLSHILEDIMDLDMKPVNITERLTFIIDSPDHFQSYIQLSKLFEELEKKWIVACRKKSHKDKN